MERKLKWFLVEYDRHEHELRNLTEYAEPEQRAEAWGRLRELEKEQFPELQRFRGNGRSVAYGICAADSRIGGSHPGYPRQLFQRSQPVGGGIPGAYGAPAGGSRCCLTLPVSGSELVGPATRVAGLFGATPAGRH